MPMSTPDGVERDRNSSPLSCNGLGGAVVVETDVVRRLLAAV